MENLSQNHHSHQLYLNKKFREVDIPPRKLLNRRGATGSSCSPIDPYEFLMDSPKSDENTLFQKFLPCNNINADDDEDPYSADHFRMYEFKVRKCNRSRSHDWTDCPFAHPGEKARRRDPRRFSYTGTVCPEFRRGNCRVGDSCEFSHGVFECWLHPSRYRTEACKDGKKCKRKVCFFAHTPRQLRLSPVEFQESDHSHQSPHGIEKHPCSHPHHKSCCLFCHSVLGSPTSTLPGVGGVGTYSPPASPPYSPARISPASRFSSGLSQFSYKDELSQLMNNLEAMNVNEYANAMASSSPMGGASNHGNLSWVDVNFNVEDQPQFVLSPSTPGNLYNASRMFVEAEEKNNDNALTSGPDLDWVNELLT